MGNRNVTQGGARLAGVVVLYRPEGDVRANIATYAGPLDLLVVVDNSPTEDAKFRDDILASGNAVYLWDGANKGIAAALNMGARLAAEKGCRWLLTMDQDSAFAAGGLEEMVRVGEASERAGIVSPRLDVPGKGPMQVAAAGEAVVVMTSGNLLNLEAYREAGPYLEKLFIDYVDHEYCLRLRKRGYRILVAEKAVLKHAYGRTAPKRLFAWTFFPTHHNPSRRYYITRNRLYVMTAYPAFIPAEAWAWAKELFKIFAFENHRALNLGYMAKGVLDFLRNRYGPLA